MPFPSEIQTALQTYDINKGRWRKLFRWDQSSIRALRRLREVDQTNCFLLYRCFIENKPKDKQESYKVYQALLGYLVQKDYSSIPETLDQLYHNKLLNLSNLNQLQALNGDHFSQLAILFRLLNTRGLLIQVNFDNIAKYLKKNTVNELTNFVTLLTLLGNRYLNQENLNCLLEKPLPDESIIRILKILAKNHMLTLENRDQLLNEKNQFLLSNHAYLAVWDRLEGHLPTLATPEKQSIFDKLISLTQAEDPQQKIGNYINQLIPEPKPRRRNTYDKFSTAPPTRTRSRSSLNDLLLFNEKPGTL